jgi:DNA-binding GntR family transcriptional regulator
MADEVATELRRLVLSGEFEDGQRLTQEKLAKMLGVSTMPVREAFLRLAAEGLIVAEPNRSFSVAGNSIADIRDIYWVYGQIVGELAARAARVADDKMIARLTELHEAHAAATEYEPRFAANWEFHRLVNLAGGTPRLLLILRSTLRFFPNLLALPGSIELASNWQRDLIKNLGQKDTEAARATSQHYARGAGELFVAARSADATDAS